MIAHRSTRTRPGVTRTINAVSSSMSVSPPTISATPRREARIWISLISSRSAMVSNAGGRDKYICDPLSPSVRLSDDLVSRQSVTVREARSLGLKGDDRFIVIEGSEAGLARAVELLKDVAPPLEGAKADDVYRRLRSQDEQAASGMGLIFGP